MGTKVRNIYMAAVTAGSVGLAVLNHYGFQERIRRSEQEAQDLGVSTEAARILRTQDLDQNSHYSESELQATEKLAKELNAAANKIRSNKQQQENWTW